MLGYNGDKPEPILSPPSSYLRGAKLPKSDVLVGCHCQESVMQFPMFTLLLTVSAAVYAKAFYVSYIS